MTLDEEKELSKLTKKLGFDYVEDLKANPKGDLDYKLLELAKYRQSIIYTKNNDKELSEAKAKKDMLEKPYKEDLRHNLDRQRLVTLIMKEKGFLEDKFLSKNEMEEGE